MTRNSRPWARAQTILLDRPHPAEAAPPLNVEIVAAEERHLLTLYRALAPGTRARGRLAVGSSPYDRVPCSPRPSTRS